MNTTNKKQLCLISDKQLEAIERALSEGKRIELSPSPSGDIKIRVVLRKDLSYNS